MPPDREICFFISSFVGRWEALDFFARLFVNDFFIPVTVSLLIILLWFMGRRSQIGMLASATSGGLSSLAVKVINWHFIPWERPFLESIVAKRAALHLFYLPHDPSFPSNGAACEFAISFGVFMVNKRLGTVLLILSSLWSLSRVYAGVHYFSDILGGIVIAGFITLFTYKILFPLSKPFLSLIFWIMERLHLA